MRNPLRAAASWLGYSTGPAPRRQEPRSAAGTASPGGSRRSRVRNRAEPAPEAAPTAPEPQDTARPGARPQGAPAHDPRHPEPTRPEAVRYEEPGTEPDDAAVGAEDWSEEDEPTLQPVAARSFSGRTLLLLLIVCVLVLPLAPTVHRYFAQQAEIDELHASIDSLQTQQEELKEEKSRWDSDDYVEQQARERLFYVKPGETPYMVAGQQEGTDQADDSSAEAAAAEQPSWGQTLWSSVAGTR